MVRIIKEKGQSLVEFAFILPILIMLLLGIVEGARIIFAYVTVQNAAREAARYAVTGRPFYCEDTDPKPIPGPSGTYLNQADISNPYNFCDDSSYGEPWRIEVLTRTRVTAIEHVAARYGKWLAGRNPEVTATDQEYKNNHPEDPELYGVRQIATGDVGFEKRISTPGWFGVRVWGQSGNDMLVDYGSAPGWDVEVETYYNVEMIDPIFSAILGDESVHLTGKVRLQNEGTDPEKGEPFVPAVNYENCLPDCGTVGEKPSAYIFVKDELGDYAEAAGNPISISVRDHNPATAYSIVLEDTNSSYVHKVSFNTDGFGNADLTVAIPKNAKASPGGKWSYRIYTFRDNIVARCYNDKSEDPCFRVTSNLSALIKATNVEPYLQPVSPPVWPLNSSIPIHLYNHDVNTTYEVLANGNSTGVQITTDGNVGSNKDGAAHYLALKSEYAPGTLTLASSINPTSVKTEVQLVEANIGIPGYIYGLSQPFPNGAKQNIVLQNLAPLQEYTLYIKDGVTKPIAFQADERGEYNLLYIVPHGTTEAGGPMKIASIYIRDRNRGINPNDIARTEIQLQTPEGPYLNVVNGQKHSAGRTIEIQAFAHVPNTTYDMRIEIGDAGSPSFSEDVVPNFTTDGFGEDSIFFTIPFDYEGFYIIRSFTESTTSPVAEYQIEVSSRPYIQIEKGNRWPPGANIKILLADHDFFEQYDVWLDRGGPYEQYIGPVTTDNLGNGSINFAIPPTLPSNIVPGYSIHSYVRSDNSIAADNGILEIEATDLIVEKIEVHSQTFDQVIPMTVTIRNQSLVTVANTFFDTDIYVDRNEPNLGNALPPGDYKLWLSEVSPGEAVEVVQDDLVLYGRKDHQIYARVDTSDNVLETNETNNMNSLVVEALCPIEIEDTPDGTIDSSWISTGYGIAAPSCDPLNDLQDPPSGVVTGFPITDGSTGSPYGSEWTDPLPDTSTGKNLIKFAKSGWTSASYLKISGVKNKSTVTSMAVPLDVSQGDTLSFSYLMRMNGLDTGEWIEFYLYNGDTGAPFSGDGQIIHSEGTGNSSSWQTDPPSADNDSSEWPVKTVDVSGVNQVWFILKMTDGVADDEAGYLYLDNVDLTTIPDVPRPSDLGTNSPNPAPALLVEEHFDSGTGAFNFTGSGSGTHGTVSVWDYSSSGSLKLDLGRSQSSEITGNFATSVTPSLVPGCITVRGYYRIKFPTSEYLFDETSEAFITLTSPLGDKQVVSLEKILGESGTDDTGWVPFNISFPVSEAGAHTITLSGSNSPAYTEGGGNTEIFFDDVYIAQPTGSSASGTQTESGGVITLGNAGLRSVSRNDNGGSAGYHYLHMPVGAGPFDVRVRVDQIPANSDDGRAGLEIRANKDNGESDKLMLQYRGNGRLYVYSRTSGSNAFNERVQNIGAGKQVWLRIVRDGDEFKFYYEDSGSTTPPLSSSWNLFHTLSNFTLPDEVQVGIINVPRSETSYEAKFSQFHVCATTAPPGIGTQTGGEIAQLQCGRVEENGNGLIVIDTINAIINNPDSSSNIWASVGMENVFEGSSGTGMEVVNSGNSFNINGPEMIYETGVETGGTYYAWLHGWAPDADSDSVYFSLNGNLAKTTVEGFPTGSADWVQVPGSFILNGNGAINTVHLTAKEDGIRVFKIVLTTNPAFVPAPEGMSQSVCTITVIPDPPPGVEQCTEPKFEYGNFEGLHAEVTGAWQRIDSAFNYSAVKYEGLRGGALQLDSSNDSPALYQRFELPVELSDLSAGKLTYRVAVDRLLGSSNPQPSDVLYFGLWRASDNFRLVTHTLATGDGLIYQPSGSVPDMTNPVAAPQSDWGYGELDVFGGQAGKAGDSLLDNPLSALEPGDEVKAVFYSPDHPGILPAEDENRTAFYIDNVDLSFCTTQPTPDSVPGLGRINGQVQRGGEPLAGIQIWAYAESGTDAQGLFNEGSGGPVYQTISDEKGFFYFYNVVPGNYLIYAQDSSGGTVRFGTQYNIDVQPNIDTGPIVINVVAGS